MRLTLTLQEHFASASPRHMQLHASSETADAVQVPEAATCALHVIAGVGPGSCFPGASSKVSGHNVQDSFLMEVKWHSANSCCSRQRHTCSVCLLQPVTQCTFQSADWQCRHKSEGHPGLHRGQEDYKHNLQIAPSTTRFRL